MISPASLPVADHPCKITKLHKKRQTEKKRMIKLALSGVCGSVRKKKPCSVWTVTPRMSERAKTDTTGKVTNSRITERGGKEVHLWLNYSTTSSMSVKRRSYRKTPNTCQNDALKMSRKPIHKTNLVRLAGLSV